MRLKGWTAVIPAALMRRQLAALLLRPGPLPARPGLSPALKQLFHPKKLERMLQGPKLSLPG